ncbi:DEAD/DEAH box helicase family protein [Lactobacillus helveticus]|uniref:Adenine phosphoribosyltransferase n=1 Tax=Lactobacillus helveticus CIRM-BIA 104 TaxID=1226333 RepID=U6F9Z5_LACHE|nr:DEAD/DEAH box helicase family protein [Lactobacillus helveticus]CDI60792.1 Adenine phosphoribosyltransferase [Lactobacillus helveticus CIRM-BIA 104]
MYKLRPYQKELISKIVDSMKKHHRVIIVQSPPRTGKTVSNGGNCQKNY